MSQQDRERRQRVVDAYQADSSVGKGEIKDVEDQLRAGLKHLDQKLATLPKDRADRLRLLFLKEMVQKLFDVHLGIIDAEIHQLAETTPTRESRVAARAYVRDQVRQVEEVFGLH